MAQHAAAAGLESGIKREELFFLERKNQRTFIHQVFTVAKAP
jgi:hypothetical protein